MPQTASHAGTPQGLNGDRLNTLTIAFSLPYPVSTIEEQVSDGSRKVFDNTVKIKSIYRIFRKFSSRFLS